MPKRDGEDEKWFQERVLVFGVAVVLRTAVFATCSRRLQITLSLGVAERHTNMTSFGLGVRKGRRKAVVS